MERGDSVLQAAACSRRRRRRRVSRSLRIISTYTVIHVHQRLVPPPTSRCPRNALGFKLDFCQCITRRPMGSSPAGNCQLLLFVNGPARGTVTRSGVLVVVRTVLPYCKCPSQTLPVAMPVPVRPPGQAWPAPHHRLCKLSKIHNYSFIFISACLSCRLILFALVPPDMNPSTLRSSKVPEACFCCCVDGYFWGHSEPRPRSFLHPMFSWHHPALMP